ncbi:hypothetical protein HPP92_015099 [Vanilla planifolia]|uniref:Uncharacterized protein n=1 Tax=Vanilla planifolia TaxID=51239 RepID=A0A835UTC3_VANPL|nr:hypothetical protein HPP92_015099 [Vanilla planifolia]
MASSRKSVTVGGNYLFRQFHPSFFHLVQHDREQPTVPQPHHLAPTSSPHRALSFLPSFYGIGSQVRDGRRMGFLFPVGCDPCSRSYSTSSKSSDEIEFMNDVADVLSETSADTDTVTIVSNASVAPASFPGEVAAAAADSFLLLQHCNT